MDNQSNVENKEIVFYEYHTAPWIKIVAVIGPVLGIILTKTGFDFPRSAIAPFLITLGLCMIPLSLLLFTCFCSLTITDKRVIGEVPIGKRVDLPIFHITAVSSGIFGLSVSTPSGVLRFNLISNKSVAYSHLNRLIMESHNK